MRIKTPAEQLNWCFMHLKKKKKRSDAFFDVSGWKKFELFDFLTKKKNFTVGEKKI